MNENQVLISDLRAYLDAPFPSTDLEISNALKGLETLRAPLLTARVQAQQDYLTAREQMRHPKDKDLTDFDRQTMLAAHTAPLQATYELLLGLEQLVSDRQTILLALL